MESVDVDVDFQSWLACGDFHDDPDVSIKGFSYVRSDVAQVTKDVQYDIFEALLDPSVDHETVIEDRLTSVVTDIVTGEYPPDDIGIPFGMSKDPVEYGSPDQTPQPQYRGAKFANKYIYDGNAMQSGDKPKYFYIVEGATGDDVRATYKAETREDGRYVDAISVLNASDLPQGCRVDWPKMARKTVLSPCEAILRTIGMDPSWLERVIERETPAEYRRAEGQKGLEAAEYM